jgi:hypothetical protein
MFQDDFLKSKMIFRSQQPHSNGLTSPFFSICLCISLKARIRLADAPINEEGFQKMKRRIRARDQDFKI